MPHFGFLVPTPSKPELAEAPDGLFATLAWHTRPRVVEKWRTALDVNVSCMLFLARSKRGADRGLAVSGVRVEHRQRVAGYDAVVLSADDADALAAWLKKHGYAQRPSLAQWLSPYVQAKWKITAFKIAAGKRSDDIATSAVRMSFKAEKPFYPYREPADMREKHDSAAKRRLRVFFVAAERYAGSLAGVEGGWPAKVKLAAPVEDRRRRLVAFKRCRSGVPG